MIPYRKQLFSAREWSWTAYDFGNSAYALIVMTLFFPLFFAEFIGPGKAVLALWGGSVAVSILIVALISPFLGAYADKAAKRKSFFIFFSLTAIIGTIMLPISAYLPIYLGILLFVVVNSAFGFSLFLYDSFLISVVRNKNASTTLSGLAWAIGYIGGPLCLILIYFVLGMNWPETLLDYHIAFLITGLFFLACAFWSFQALPADNKSSQALVTSSTALTVFETIRMWRETRHIFVFLFGMYFIMDGLMTIVYFIALFAKKELGFSLNQIVMLLLIVQSVGIFATALMGWLADRFGELRILILCSAMWVIIVVLMYFNTDYDFYIAIAALTGLVVGSTPAVARGFLGKVVPPEKRAELFGFNSFASRIATLIGPLIFGVVASAWNMKVALFTVIPFFVIGVLILLYLSANFRRWAEA